MSLRACSRFPARLAALVVMVVAATAARSADTPADSPRESPLLHELRRFATLGTVLHVAAHPDDENTQLITAFSRGRGYRTAYLSITRGDGGQNERGPDFAEKLGVLRTQELLAARRLDGGRQFFTRAIDYGYSKSPQEALRIWDHAAVLGDVVRVIRQFRPDVIVTRFPIPPGSGGHGQHTASAMLAVEAFKLAADPTAYPEQIRDGLAPWQAKRIGWNGWGNQSPLSGPIIQFDIGGVDPVSGEPFGTIANQSRGMHKTQTLGRFSDQAGSAGPNLQNFQLLAGDAPTGDIMDGVDTTWARVPGGSALVPLIADAIAKFDAAKPAATVPALAAIRKALDRLPLDSIMAEKRRDLDGLIQACLGVTVETTVPQAEVMAGDTLALHHEVTFASSTPVRWVAVRYPAGKGELKVNTGLRSGGTTVRNTTQTLPAGTTPSQPYWLRHTGTPGLFHVDDPALIGTPQNPPVFPVEFVFETGGHTFTVTDEPVQLVPAASPAQARRPLAIIPPVSLAFAHGLELLAPGSTKTVTVEVTAARAGAKGKLRLTAPAGWGISPEGQSFALAQAGDKTAVSFQVTAPAAANAGTLAAAAEVDGVTCATSRSVLNYSHLPVQLLQSPAEIPAVALDVQTRGKRVGYLPGAGDSTAESLAQLGYEVVVLRGSDLTADKLAGLDAVVIGVRAFNDRDDLATNLPTLFAWVEAGGTVVAQYNRPNNLKATALGPYELSLEGPAPRQRVTDETAPVTFLTPDHPVLSTPNKITAADFEGWVQERGAYYPSKWDEAHYTPILAMNDPGEAPLRSSVLVARHGKGWYVYTGLAFFRQLPAGVPGAQRLFANLVSLGK
jgi:LmbE family N-acetylglucosaminyl deacetylase